MSLDFNSSSYGKGDNIASSSTLSSFPKKSGSILKRGDGPIDYNWNERYLILDGLLLMYYKHASDKTPRGVIKLKEVTISEISRIDDQEYAFSIETPNSRKYYFSCSKREESLSWLLEISRNVKSQPKISSRSSKRRASVVKTFGARGSMNMEGKDEKYEIEEFPFVLYIEFNFRKLLLFKEFLNILRIKERNLNGKLLIIQME